MEHATSKMPPAKNDNDEMFLSELGDKLALQVKRLPNHVRTNTAKCGLVSASLLEIYFDLSRSHVRVSVCVCVRV